MSDSPDVMRALGRIEGVLEGIEKAMRDAKDAAETMRAEHASTIKKHDERIGKLERGRAWLMGAAAGVGAVSSVAVKYLTGGGAH